jgi:hypothetical protein
LLRDNPGQVPGLIARWLGHGLDFSDA